VNEYWKRLLYGLAQLKCNLIFPDYNFYYDSSNTLTVVIVFSLSGLMSFAVLQLAILPSFHALEPNIFITFFMKIRFS